MGIRSFYWHHGSLPYDFEVLYMPVTWHKRWFQVCIPCKTSHWLWRSLYQAFNHSWPWLWILTLLYLVKIWYSDHSSNDCWMYTGVQLGLPKKHCTIQSIYIFVTRSLFHLEHVAEVLEKDFTLKLVSCGCGAFQTVQALVHYHFKRKLEEKEHWDHFVMLFPQNILQSRN